MLLPNYSCKIAIINPVRPDGLARTIFDGILGLNCNGSHISIQLSNKFDYYLPLNEYYLPEDQFINFARKADLIFIIWGKDGTDVSLAQKINCWEKTIYIDGSEVGRNRRYDFSVQRKILEGTYRQNGRVDKELLKRCAGYFRREKPYLEGIKPLPFGIETRYLAHYQESKDKDIDFLCVFGQEEYPLLRYHARQLTEKFCAKHGFICSTTKTKNSDEFYKLLARSKVGISVGGGGYDTFRFWEILANNCLLLTEAVDVFQPDSARLNYQRIYPFGNVFDFQFQIEEIGRYLRQSYDPKLLNDEYQLILSEHNTMARVGEILQFAQLEGLI